VLFVKPQVKVYEGMIVGVKIARAVDLDVKPDQRESSNMRTTSADEATRPRPAA